MKIKNIDFKHIPNKLGTGISTKIVQTNIGNLSREEYINSENFYKLYSAIDIDWNGAVIDEETEINDTSDLIQLIYQLKNDIKLLKLGVRQKNNKKVNFSYNNCIDIDTYIEKLIEVYDIIENYNSNNEYDSNKLLTRYIRSIHYNDQYWTTLYGQEDNNLKELIDSTYPDFKDIDYVYVLDNTYIDIVHFWAAMDALFSNYTDLGGWAGDIVDFATYLDENPNIEFPGKGFEHEDVVADFDAIMVYKDYAENEISIVNSFVKTYNSLINIKTKEEADRLRIQKFIEFKNSDDINQLYNSSDSKILLNVLAMQRHINNEQLNIAINALQEYVDKYK